MQALANGWDTAWMIFMTLFWVAVVAEAAWGLVTLRHERRSAHVTRSGPRGHAGAFG